jgi:hypothetical protein
MDLGRTVLRKGCSVKYMPLAPEGASVRLVVVTASGRMASEASAAKIRTVPTERGEDKLAVTAS